MAGTLTISTLSDGTNSTSATNCIQGSAKAWVNFNGTNGSIRASYNTSSITRNGVGDYTMTFTNAMTDANYSVSGSSDRNGSIQCLSLAIYNGTAPTTTSVRLRTDQNGTALDGVYVCAVINR